MDKILDFMADNRLIFAVISLVLLLALIGLLVSRKKKNVVKEESDSQPIAMDKNENQIDEAITQTQAPSPMQEIQIQEQTQMEPTIEPSLENFTSSETEVNVSGYDVNKIENNMLVIEDNNIKQNFNQNESVIMQEENNSQMPIETTPITPTLNEAPTLIIEDKTSGESNNIEENENKSQQTLQL